MLQNWTQAVFADRVGEEFCIRVNDSTQVTLKLDEVSGRGAKLEKPFSVVFCGPADGYLPQGTYRLNNVALGSIELFIVPIGPDVDGRHMRYEAVFN